MKTKTEKDFDCVRMKWEIQSRIRAKYTGIPEEQARQMQWKRVLEDPVLGPFVSKVLSGEKVPSS